MRRTTSAKNLSQLPRHSHHDAPCSRLLTVPGLALAALGFLATAGGALAQEIAPRALEQIAALVEEKRSRTAARQKISSRLLYELEARQGSELLQRVPKLVVARHARADGTVLVDLDAAVDDGLLVWLETLGGTVHSAFPRWDAVRASLPIDRLEELAGHDRVRFVRPADIYMTQMNTSEGDVAHAADVARVTFGVDGTGVKVGAMSDSVDALADLQASGDLPPGVTVLPGQSGNPGTSEGTALLEIVHDLAPGAELFFATGAGGQAQMAQNILDLAAAGCRVIVDDVLYLTEAVFQDGVIAQAVDEVAAQGVAYFSAAGNSGNLAAGTAGVWEGDYAGIALPGPLEGFGLSAHDFGGGQNSNEITFDAPLLITLQWSDPQDASANDYDLYLLDATLTNVLGASTITQNGIQDPVEALDSIAPDDTGNRLVVVKFAGDDRFLNLNTHRGQLAQATDGQIFGHPAAEGAIAVAAVNVATAGGGVFTGGAANPAEPFTSDGPRRIFFEADGTPIGGSPLQGGQGSTTREVPDVAAADGVSTATPGFNPFFGTSAAAPHAAGIAALVQEVLSSLSAPGMDGRIKKDALDIETPGSDPVSGAGIPRADNAIEGKRGFQGDTFSVKTKLAKSGGSSCSAPHIPDPGDDIVEFDGFPEGISSPPKGNPADVLEFEAFPDSLDNGEGGLQGDGDPPFESELSIGSDTGEDLFPEGFEDPETGDPLDSACVEIGLDDPLEADCPVNVVSAQLEAFSNGVSVFGPIDVTSAFSPGLWNGFSTLRVPGLVGMGVNKVRLKLEMEPSNQIELFSDGFESGDASSWTDQVP